MGRLSACMRLAVSFARTDNGFMSMATLFRRHPVRSCCSAPVWRRLHVQAIFCPTCPIRKETTMANDHIYKQIELVGSSTVSSDDAISQAIARASSTLRELDWRSEEHTSELQSLMRIS